jgi:hypothetical protein
MGEEEQMIAIGRTVTRYRDLKAHMAALELKAREFAGDMERVSQALKNPLRADPVISIPETAEVRAVLRDVHDTALQLDTERRNLIQFGVEPKD